MAKGKSGRLAILSGAEQEAVWGLPDFDDKQRQEFLSLYPGELILALGRPGLPAQVHCILQTGYFRAKQAFFRFTPEEVSDDVAFVMARYFSGRHFSGSAVTQHEHYVQRGMLASAAGYRLWSAEFVPDTEAQATLATSRDATPASVATELIVWLNRNRIVRPEYTTQQDIISRVLSAERRRLGESVDAALDGETRTALKKLLVKDDTLSGLTVLRQDAADFRWRQMATERRKRTLLAPLYRTAKALLPSLDISVQNLCWYASLVNFYTIYDLRRLQPQLTQLYLLCFAWMRYRQLTDNLADAMIWHMKKFESETAAIARKTSEQELLRTRRETPRVERLLSLYVDDDVPDSMSFDDIRQRAWKIMPRNDLMNTAYRLSVSPVSRLVRQWDAVDQLSERIRRQMRPLFMSVEFGCSIPHSPWAAALSWVRSVFSRQQQLSQRPLSECPSATLPKRLSPYLLESDDGGNPVRLRAARYEFWLYRQLRKRLKSGELHIDDSFQYRHLADELVSPEEQQVILKQLDIPFLRQPMQNQLDNLSDELHQQWMDFSRELQEGKLPYLDYDKRTGTLSWRRHREEYANGKEQDFYARLPMRNIADILHFVDAECGFLSCMTPLQPRYVKKKPIPAACWR